MKWFGLPTLLAKIPPADSVSPDVGSEQWELDLKWLPHFHLQVKGIVLRIKESVHHSPDTCSTAQVSMMFEVPPFAIHFPSIHTEYCASHVAVFIVLMHKTSNVCCTNISQSLSWSWR